MMTIPMMIATVIFSDINSHRRMATVEVSCTAKIISAYTVAK
jgi:hypothetical protein